jgi:hypothetical protein
LSGRLHRLKGRVGPDPVGAPFSQPTAHSPTRIDDPRRPALPPLRSTDAVPDVYDAGRLPLPCGRVSATYSPPMRSMVERLVVRTLGRLVITNPGAAPDRIARSDPQPPRSATRAVVVPDLTIDVPALRKTAVARHLRLWWWRSRRVDERCRGSKPTGVVGGVGRGRSPPGSSSPSWPARCSVGV